MVLLGQRLTRAAAFARLGALHVRNARVCTMLDKETMTTQPLVLLTSDGYCYAKEDSHEYATSVVGSQFLDLYRKARRASGLKHILLVLDVHREHAEHGHLFGEDGALKHFWYDIACLKLSPKKVQPIWGLEATDKEWQIALNKSCLMWIMGGNPWAITQLFSSPLKRRTFLDRLHAGTLALCTRSASSNAMGAYIGLTSHAAAYGKHVWGLNIFNGKYMFPPHANAWLYELLDYKTAEDDILKDINVQDYRVQPIPDSCALVPCEGRSAPFCIVGSTRALYEARNQMWEYLLKRALKAGWGVREEDGSASWNHLHARWARSFGDRGHASSIEGSKDWSVFWHWTVGKWVWNDHTGECAVIDNTRAQNQHVRAFIPPWVLLSWELPLLWGLHDDDSAALTDDSSSSASELVIPPLPRHRPSQSPKRRK